MTFGMRNAPATFQHMMHVVLGDDDDLDDVVVYSDILPSVILIKPLLPS